MALKPLQVLNLDLDPRLARVAVALKQRLALNLDQSHTALKPLQVLNLDQILAPVAVALKRPQARNPDQ